MSIRKKQKQKKGKNKNKKEEKTFKQYATQQMVPYLKSKITPTTTRIDAIR